MIRRGLITVSLGAVAIVLLAVSAAMAFPAVEVYKMTSPAVVLIVASSDSGGGSLVGAGSVITRDGMIITNAHVVVDDASGRPYKRISVYTRPEEITGDFQKDLKYSHSVSVVDYDRDLDLALLRSKDLGASTGVISLADPKEIMVGEEVVAIGHPEQGGLWSLTYGRISGQIADQGKVKGKNVYQTDTSVNRGNSGGPLLDKRGYLVGVNTNIARRGSGDLAITGVNFALKSSVVSSWLKKTQRMTLAYGSQRLQGEEAMASAKAPAREAAPESSPEREPEGMTAKAGAAGPLKAQEPETQVVSDGKKEEPEAEEPEEPEAEKKPMASDTIITPKKPYRAEDLYKAVERDMEDMMEDMKGKFRSRKRY